ncbi:MAG: 2TM domain-containing protein, partial [Promethearchaeota archaeon]
KSKVANLWILLTHITYFIVVTILAYTVIPTLLDTTIQNINAINTTISWSTFLGVHIFSYLLYFYNESIKPVIKGLIIHMTIYIASNILIIYQWLKSDLIYFYPIYSLILWGAIISIHVFLSIKYDYMIKDALTKVEKYYEGADKYKLHSEARVFLISQYSFISHLIVYVAGIILIVFQLAILGIDLGIIVHPIMGWMIGVSIHGALYLIILLNIRGFWKWTFTLHFAAYISTSIYLIILNVLTGGILWSAISIVGWGIGIGIHAILAFVR